MVLILLPPWTLLALALLLLLTGGGRALVRALALALVGGDLVDEVDACCENGGGGGGKRVSTRSLYNKIQPSVEEVYERASRARGGPVPNKSKAGCATALSLIKSSLSLNERGRGSRKGAFSKIEHTEHTHLGTPATPNQTRASMIIRIVAGRQWG